MWWEDAYTLRLAWPACCLAIGISDRLIIYQGLDEGMNSQSFEVIWKPPGSIISLSPEIKEKCLF